MGAKATKHFRGQDALASQCAELSLGGSADIAEGTTKTQEELVSPREMAEATIPQRRSRKWSPHEIQRCLGVIAILNAGFLMATQSDGQCSRDGLAPACYLPRGEPVQLRQQRDGWYFHSVLVQVLDDTVPPFWLLALGPAQVARRPSWF